RRITKHRRGSRHLVWALDPAGRAPAGPDAVRWSYDVTHTNDMDGRGAGTTAGLVCAHHHLYSSLARGMPGPTRTPTSFLDVLEQIWWRLDTVLDPDLIEWSAKLGALEALEAGCTAIVDHHESPNAI